MNKWLIPPALAVILLISWIATTQITKETILNEAQISSRVETFYNGTVDRVLKKSHQYFITFTTTDGVYEVAVDEENGRFSKLHLIKEIQPPEEIKPEVIEEVKPPVEQEITPEPEEKPVLLTKQQVQSIAQKQYQGEVEEITFYTTTDGGYYLVEIDTDEDITLQIHAITGKVLSVSFDD